MSKRNIQVLSLSDKLKIVNAFESRKTRNEIQREFNLPESTYYKIIKSKDSIKSECSDGHGNIKRTRVSEFNKIEKCLLEWIKQTLDKNTPIDGPLLKEKSKEFATRLGIQNFSASNGWLQGFKRRHHIAFKKAAGESKSVDQDSNNASLEAPENPTKKIKVEQVDDPLASTSKQVDQYIIETAQDEDAVWEPQGQASLESQEPVLSEPGEQKPVDKLADEKLEICALQKTILQEELQEKRLKRQMMEDEMQHKNELHKLAKEEMILRIEILKTELENKKKGA